MARRVKNPDHPKAHWHDAARMLRAAARLVELAADGHATIPLSAVHYLRRALTQIDAAVARIESDSQTTRDSQETQDTPDIQETPDKDKAPE